MVVACVKFLSYVAQHNAQLEGDHVPCAIHRERLGGSFSIWSVRQDVLKDLLVHVICRVLFAHGLPQSVVHGSLSEVATTAVYFEKGEQQVACFFQLVGMHVMPKTDARVDVESGPYEEFDMRLHSRGQRRNRGDFAVSMLPALLPRSLHLEQGKGYGRCRC